jgi:hypothetical protein
VQYPASFHDVTTGNNSMYCLSGAASCGAFGFLTGYNAAAGYDLASGLGSIDATQLVQNWSKVTFKASATSLTVNGSTAPVSVEHGKSVSVGVTVTGTGGTPTGNVALVGSGSPAAAAAQINSAGNIVPSPSVLTLANGTATNADYTYLPGGSYNLSANYAGDGTFGPSVSTPPIAVTVSAEPSTLELFIEDFALNGQGATPTSVPYGTYVSVAAQPYSTAQANASQPPTYAQQATGTVTFHSTPALAALDQTVTINSNGFAEVPGQTTLAYPPGIYSVSASYSGDPSFSASSAAAQSFTITKNSVSIASANGSTSGTVLVEVDPASANLQLNSGLTLPTGTVTLTNSSGAAVGTGTLAVVTNPTTGTTAAQTTITVSGTATTINYAGDTNYSAGTAAFTPGGGGSGSFTLSAAPAAVTVPSGGSASTTINISPQNSFAGTVTVTCSVTGGPTCSLAKPSVAVSGTAAVPDTLTVAAGSASSALHIPSTPSRGTWYAAGGAAFAGILLIGLPGRRRAWQRMLSLMLLVIAIGVVGCGGTSSSGGNGGSTNYTVTVTATSGSITQTTTVTATVQ